MNKQDYIKNKIKLYYRNKHIKHNINFFYLERRNKDVIYKIIDNLSRRAYESLKHSNIIKTTTHMQLIGCTVDELKEHINKQLNDDMTFDNYGLWEIDHIIPVSSFDFNSQSEIIECFNYKNLQPLWREDNIKKSNKINSQFLNEIQKGETIVSRNV